MKVIRHLLVAAALGGGFASCVEARVSIGVGITAPAFPVVPADVPSLSPPPR